MQASGAALVSDPAEQQWTHVLSWDGTNWTAATGRRRHARESRRAAHGATAIKKNLPAGAKLWVNLPPSKELAAKLKPAGTDSAVQLAANLTDALTRSPACSPPTVPLMPGITRANSPPDRRRPMRPRTVPAAPPLRSIPCARLGSHGVAPLDRRRQRQAEPLFIAACQGAWLARTGKQSRRRLHADDYSLRWRLLPAFDAARRRRRRA